MLSKIFSILFSLPRIIWFNLRYLPFNQALKLPILIAPNVRIKKLYRGGIILKNVQFNSCHIGFHCADAVDCYGCHTIVCIEKGGKWIIENDIHIGRGAIIHIKPEATLSVGKNFAISGTTSIICSKDIQIGKDVQFSWNSLAMDSDAHKIYSQDGKISNPDSPVVIGNKVWIAANTTILKGSEIKDNCIVACNSMVNKAIKEDNCIIAGSPAKAIKTISHWEI